MSVRFGENANLQKKHYLPVKHHGINNLVNFAANFDTMHEMSLAMSVMDIARKEMQRAGKTQLVELEIAVGEHAGVERETFLTALDALTRLESGEKVRIRINDVEARAECLMCGKVFRPQIGVIRECPQCGSCQCLLVAGTDFRLVSVTCR